MKRILLLIMIVLLSAGSLFADWSGLTDSTFSYSAGAGTAASHSFGFEQYANLRYQVRTGDMATFFASLNLVAMSGSLSAPAVASGLALAGENYAAGIELERLYFRIAGEQIRTEMGLIRMAFGYSQVWGSTDFLNPRTPLIPNARPRGVLGWNSSMYLNDDLRIMAFAAAPRNPLQSSGGGFIPGFSLDQYWGRGNLMGFYAFETPRGIEDSLIPGIGSINRSLGVHNFGLSMKFDLELSFTADFLYSLNLKNLNGLDSLSAGLGFDYSFLEGDLFVLFEYLYNGSTSSTALGYGGFWSNNHYLSGSAMYRIDDYMSLTFTVIICFDDPSFLPILAFNYEVFQGFSVNTNIRLPIGGAGELGPEGLGTKFAVNAGARLRF